MVSEAANEDSAGNLGTVSAFRTAALADPDNFVEHMRHFRNVSNAPFRTSMSTLVEDLRFVVFSQFSTVPPAAPKQVSREFHDAYRDRSALLALITAQSDNLLKSAQSQVGTHTAKIPNPAVESPTALFSSKEVFAEASSLKLVSTASISTGQRIGAAGNAALGKTQRLLSTRFEIDGKMVDVVEDMVARGPITKALAAVGFSSETLETVADALAARVQDSEGELTPGRGTKQLLWPTDNGDVAITPVHPYAMHIELSKRLEERRKTGAWINTTFVVVGGTQPQNAGLVNGDLGGRHRMLLGVPPKTESFECRATFRDAARGQIDFGQPSADAVKELVKSLKAVHKDNRQARLELEVCIRKVIVGIAMPFIRFRDASWHDEVSPEKIKSPKWANPLLLHGYAGVEERRPRLLEDVARSVLETIPPEILGAGDDNLDVAKVIKSVADEFFSDVFKGATN